MKSSISDIPSRAISPVVQEFAKVRGNSENSKSIVVSVVPVSFWTLLQLPWLPPIEIQNRVGITAFWA
jgi:hypothetical protein